MPCLFLLAGAGARAAEPPGDRDGPEAHRRREEWWQRQRALPAGMDRRGVHQAAMARWETLVERARKAPSRGPKILADTVAAWRELGPAPLSPTDQTPNSGPVSGRLRAIALHPKTPDILYVGAAQGGVWKSIDRGARWRALGDDQPALAVAALALDPDAPDTIYAGTGENNFGFYGQGLLKSVDGGTTWTRPAGTRFAGSAITKILIESGGRIWLSASAGSQGVGDYCTSYHVDPASLGLWSSSDGGVTFSRLADGGVTDFEVDTTANPRRLYYAVSNVGGFLLVEGSSPRLLSGLPTADSTPRVRDIELALSPSDPKLLYAGMGLDGKRAALYLSKDRGATFTAVANPPDYCGAHCGYTNVIAFHPTDPGTLFLGGAGCSLWRSTDALAPVPTFRAVSMPNGLCKANAANWYLHLVHPDAHAFAFQPGSPQTIYAATDGGLVRSGDGGSTWLDRNQGLGAVQFYGICVDPADPEHIYGGAQDNGSMERSGKPVEWQGLITGDGGPWIASAQSGTEDPCVILRDTNASIAVTASDPPGAVLHLAAASSEDWLTVTPFSARAAGALTVTVTAKALPIGEYDATLTLTDPSAAPTSLAVPVHLSVREPPACGCRLGARGGGASLLGLVLLAFAARFGRGRRRRASGGRS
ncbi:MAG: hypothetical protein EXR72_02520 [Myxococcales bacterium]|nr:hypothetical protein [Myxococcales bacterium]